MPVEIPIYAYDVPTSQGLTLVLSFAPSSRARPHGTLVAPEGSELRRGQATLIAKLKVPRAGRVGEFSLLSAGDAYEAARAGEGGLTLKGGVR